MMLTKKRSPRVNYVARIMVLPLTILVFAAFSLKTKPETVFKKIQGFALIPGSSDNPKPVNTYVTDTIPEKTFRRAITSINKPIYFLDGEEIDSAAVAKLNPNELASIYVLKGEKAFEKYGPKAINGAIEISRKDIQKGLNARPDIVYEVPLQNITPDNDSAWINLRELPIKEEQKNQQTAKLLESKLAEATDIKISEQGKKLYERQLTELKEKLITEEIKLAKIDYEKKQQAYLNAVKDLQKSAAAKKMQEKQLLELKRKLNAGLLNKVKLNYTENLKANLALQQKKSLGLMQKQKINTELLDLAKLKYAEARKINSGVDKLALQQKELQTVEGYLIFTKTEINPRFTGGHEAWIKFLRANLKVNVPVDNGAKAGKYTVVLRFIVNADGTLSDITCETDPGFGICAEAIRFIKTTPKWQPAFQNGKKVNAYMKQPITFVVEE